MSRATGSCVETRHRLVEDFSNKTKMTLLPLGSGSAHTWIEHPELLPIPLSLTV